MVFANSFVHAIFQLVFVKQMHISLQERYQSMQHISNLVTQSKKRGGGGRVASNAYRQSLAQCEDFAGLEQNTNRYDLLLLVKRTGKIAGFSPRMIHLLDYYMAFTSELDWEEGSRPIVYQSLSRTALDLGVSERQIQKLEKQLFEVGAITYNDSGNHKRYGRRDPATGRILYAFGVELTPLAYLKEELLQKLEEKHLYDDAWMQTKRQISWYRRQIRSILLEMQEEGAHPNLIGDFQASYDEIAIQLRTHIDLGQMRTLLQAHSELHSRVLDSAVSDSGLGINASQNQNLAEETTTSSCTSEHTFAHYKYTTPIKNNCSPKGTGFQKSVAEPSEPKDLILGTGLNHISIKQVLLASSERFKEHLPLKTQPVEWNEIVEAAYRLKSEMHISQQSWGEACEILGRVGASICVVITDQAMQRAENPVSKPAAYFRGMVNKARVGELKLHNSIFGLSNASASRSEVYGGL